MSAYRKIQTPRGVASILARGIRANFAPPNQSSQFDHLVDLFHDMAMSRSMDGENQGDHWAQTDAQWLEELADELNHENEEE
jgi:hypothetical protein